MTEIIAPSFNRLQVTEPEEMTWNNDMLERKEYADKLTTLIKNTKGPYVIGLTSPWGSGKTFFLQAWRHQLLEEKKPCIYFNAWEMDASGDPLINLMAAIQEQAQKQSFLASLVRLFEKAKWLPGILNGTGKIAGYFKIPYASAVKAASEIVKNAQNYLNSAKNFKSDLEKAAEELSAQAEGFPLFIMVDELDRCRPSYAIELLERIKHLFNVPHVVFIMAIDSTQLLQQVEHTFGLKPHEENGDIIQDPRRDYLGKFFDIYYNLPPVENRKFVQMLLSKDSRLDEYSKAFQSDTSLSFQLSLCDVLSSNNDLFKNKTLRILTQDIEYFSIFIKLYDNLTIEYIFFAFWMIFSSKHHDHGQYNKNIAIEFEKYIKSYLSEKNTLFTKLKNNELNKFILYNNLQSAEYCAYLFINFCMCNNIEDIIKVNKFVITLSSSYFAQRGFLTNGRYGLINLKKVTNIADDAYSRLQFLKEFHSVQEEKISQLHIVDL